MFEAYVVCVKHMWCGIGGCCHSSHARRLFSSESRAAKLTPPHSSIYAYVCIYMCIYIYMCVYVYLCMCVCVCVCVYVYIYTYEHLHTLPTPPHSLHTRILTLKSRGEGRPAVFHSHSLSHTHTNTNTHTHTHTPADLPSHAPALRDGGSSPPRVRVPRFLWFHLSSSSESESLPCQPEPL
jgi:hypothetical protein